MSQGLNSSSTDEISLSSSNSSQPNNHNHNIISSSGKLTTTAPNLHHSSSSSNIPNYQHHHHNPNHPAGFIRVKLLELDPAPSLYHPQNTNNNTNPSNSVHLDPYCAVSIKESLVIGRNNNNNTNLNNNNNKVIKQGAPKIKATFNTRTDSAKLLLAGEEAEDADEKVPVMGDSTTTTLAPAPSPPLPATLKLVQRKPTFYPKWNTCFDCHLYPGRHINVVIMNSQPNEYLGEATVVADELAAKAKDRLTHQDWVRLYYIII